MRSGRLLPWVAAGMVLLQSGTATGFCRTSTCELSEDDAEPICMRDVESGCVTEGKPLRWASPCITYAIQRDGSPASGIDAEALQLAVEEAFAAWQNVRCPQGGSPRFQATFQGFVACDRREAVCGGASKNVNVIMFHDQGWSDAGAIGLTTPSAGTTSGTIVDADLELNSQDFDFANPASPAGAVLADVLTHELGHFLGLSHSFASGALMSRDYQDVTLSRELLTDDDVAAICSVFPPGNELTCGEPRAPAYDDCQLALGEEPACTLPTVKHGKSSCSVSVPRPEGSAVPWWLLAAGLIRRQARRYWASRQQRVPVL